MLKRKNLAKLRIDLGLKSKELADLLKLSRVHYSNIENGKVDPTFEFIEKFERFCKENEIYVDDIWEVFKKSE